MKLTELPFEQKEVICVTKKERLFSTNQLSSSLGNQLKWKHGDRYIKLDCLGYEGIAEHMVSWFLSFTDIPRFAYVSYHTCVIYEDGKLLGTGCYSSDYLRSRSEVTFAQLLEKYALPASIGYDALREFLLDVTHIDIKGYVDTTLCLDAITRNEDRHLGNWGFSWDGKEYELLPIFDNGGSCLSDKITYPMQESFDKNYLSVQAKPFSTNFSNQIGFVKRLGVRYADYVNSMSLYSSEAKRAEATILRGLEEMKGIAWEDI